MTQDAPPTRIGFLFGDYDLIVRAPDDSKNKNGRWEIGLHLSDGVTGTTWFLPSNVSFRELANGICEPLKETVTEKEIVSQLPELLVAAQTLHQSYSERSGIPVEVAVGAIIS